MIIILTIIITIIIIIIIDYMIVWTFRVAGATHAVTGMGSVEPTHWRTSFSRRSRFGGSVHITHAYLSLYIHIYTYIYIYIHSTTYNILLLLLTIIIICIYIYIYIHITYTYMIQLFTRALPFRPARGWLALGS